MLRILRTTSQVLTHRATTSSILSPLQYNAVFLPKRFLSNENENKATGSSEPVSSTTSESASSKSSQDDPLRFMKEEFAEEIEDIRKMYKDREERHGSLIGQVVSVKNAKSIVVSVPYKKYMPKYNISINRTSRIMAHDAEELANLGDVVRIVPCRPMSAKKRHSLKDVVKPRHISKFDPVRTKRSMPTKVV